jgi:ribulose bisphosphate carboxylase small subunit
MAGDRERKPSAGASPTDISRLGRTFAWLGKNFVKGILTALAAILVSGGIAVLMNEENATSKRKELLHPVKSHHARFDSWPDEVNAWTVVLASEASKGLAESAVEKAKRVASRGLNIGVLYSSDYSSLRPGYWVAFAGQFDSVEEAQQAAERYRSQFPSTYQRFVEQR